jgi:hypothetical protein
MVQGILVCETFLFCFIFFLGKDKVRSWQFVIKLSLP